MASGYVYNATLLDKTYTLVPDREWILKNTPRSRAWSIRWDCNKIAIDALAYLQTHAVGAVVVGWPDKDHTHALLLVCYEQGKVELFDPHSRKFHELKDRPIFKLWM